MRHFTCVALLVAPALVFGKSRSLSAQERHRCGSEIAEIERLRIHYSLAQTSSGFPLAVYKNTESVNDIVSSALLSPRGEWEGDMVRQSLDLAVAYKRLSNMHSQRQDCQSPPCHAHVAIDIGANVGYWTFMAASRGFKVISIEGAPTNVALLRLSLCVNPGLAPLIDLRPKLLGSREGLCVIALPAINIGDGTVHCELDGHTVDWTVDQMRRLRDGNYVPYKIERVFRVGLSRLDAILEDAWNSDTRMPHTASFLKIDIEGSEYTAFNASLSWLKAKRLPIVYSEVWKAMRGGINNYLRLFEEFGYEVHKGSCVDQGQIITDRNRTVFTTSMEDIAEICAHIPMKDLREPVSSPWE